MKKITSAVLGLSLTLAVAGLSFAAQATPAPAAANNSAPVAKKHVKKNKKAVKGTTSATPAPAPAK
ncbi:MAG TPA: hypothetical protein VHZ74_03805 [Bryobacteraceae bacterium]|jgi:hypothetical protein|nr:hypothetical protein [Bryobacteraceae bacterium]